MTAKTPATTTAHVKSKSQIIAPGTAATCTPAHASATEGTAGSTAH